MQIRSTGWDERKWNSSVLLARRPPVFHWWTLRESWRRGGRRRRRTARSKGRWWGGRGKRYKMGGWGIRSLKARVAGSAALAEGSQIVQWRYTRRWSPRRESQCYSRVGSSKSESGQELWIWRGKVMSTLDRPIWSRCSIALTCPAQSHFQRTLNEVQWGQGWNERYRSSREGEK